MQQLTVEEEGVYIRLLTHMWTMGESCTLPDDDSFLRRLCAFDKGKWAKIRQVLVDGPTAVFQKTNGRLTNKRLSEEYFKALGKLEKAVSAGRASGSARRTPVERSLNGCSTDAEPMTNHIETDTDTDPEKTEEPPIGGAAPEAPPVAKVLSPTQQFMADQVTLLCEAFGLDKPPKNLNLFSQIGRWRKDFGEAWTAQAIESAVTKHSAHPFENLEACVNYARKTAANLHAEAEQRAPPGTGGYERNQIYDLLRGE